MMTAGLMAFIYRGGVGSILLFGFGTLALGMSIIADRITWAVGRLERHLPPVTGEDEPPPRQWFVAKTDRNDLN